MVLQSAWASAVEIGATAFREDGSAELVRVLELTFDELTFSSKAQFVGGERLRVHIAGQGWIQVEVLDTSSDRTRAAFASVCRV